MQLAAFIFRQLPARTFPRGLRERLRGLCFAGLPPVTSAAGTVTPILYTERSAIESVGQYNGNGRLHRQHTTQHQDCHQGLHHALFLSSERYYVGVSLRYLEIAFPCTKNVIVPASLTHAHTKV